MIKDKTKKRLNKKLHQHI